MRSFDAFVYMRTRPCERLSPMYQETQLAPIGYWESGLGALFPDWIDSRVTAIVKGLNMLGLTLILDALKRRAELPGSLN